MACDSVRDFLVAKTAKGAPAHNGHDHEAEPDAHGATCKEGHDHDAESKVGHADAHQQADAHDDHSPSDHASEPGTSVTLSPTAQANVGLKLAKVELQPFERTVSIQAMIVERPGRSTVHVAAPLAGVVSHIRPMQGETVAEGQELFELRVTHEDIIEAQSDLLRTVEDLDVIHREIARLEQVTASGAVAGRTLLERKYDQQKLEAALRSQRQRLMLHGLAASQIDSIQASRTLLSQLSIRVPDDRTPSGEKAAAAVFQVQELKVVVGQHLKAGDPLCVLADHSELYIEGKAFEHDIPVLDKAVNKEWAVSAVVEAHGQPRQKIRDLKIQYLANKVEPESRSVLFYVPLPNKPARDQQTPEGHRFTTWQYRPGQRVELLVPVERWSDRIVLPVEALAQDGPDSYVFEQHEGQFCRRPVKVEYRDQYSAVIGNDGALTPGDIVIVSGTYQVHLAMKNKAGGAPDPHAGHNH